VIAQCNQFLGPTQPGVTTADPTRSGAAATSAPEPKPASATPEPKSSDTNAALDFLLGQ